MATPFSTVPEGIEWLYSNPSVQTTQEEYLLGKPISGSNSNEMRQLPLGLGGSSNATAAASQLSSGRVNEETLRRLREDPLFIIRHLEKQQQKLSETHPVLQEQKRKQRKREQKSALDRSQRLHYEDAQKECVGREVFHHSQAKSGRSFDASYSPSVRRNEMQGKQRYDRPTQRRSTPSTDAYKDKQRAYSPLSRESKRYRHDTAYKRPLKEAAPRRHIQKTEKPSRGAYDAPHRYRHTNTREPSPHAAEIVPLKERFPLTEESKRDIDDSWIRHSEKRSKGERIAKQKPIERREQQITARRPPEDWNESALPVNYFSDLGPPQSMIDKATKLQSINSEPEKRKDEAAVEGSLGTEEMSARRQTATVDEMLMDGLRHEVSKSNRITRIAAKEQLQEALEDELRRKKDVRFLQSAHKSIYMGNELQLEDRVKRLTIKRKHQATEDIANE